MLSTPHLAPRPVALPLPGAKFWRIASYVILALGLALRLVVWAQQRSIVLDEANLLRNFVERSYPQLFQSLSYEQYAPPLFSVIVKATIQAFGNNELSVRLFPLLCSLLTLALFRRLALRWLPLPYACLALSFVAFGGIYIDYATECKQYACDGLVALALLEVAQRVPLAHARPSAALAAGLSLLGMVVVWLSMPAVFVLGGMGLWWLLRAYQARDPWRLGLVAAIALSWAASFGVYFFWQLKPTAGLGNLKNFHHEYFLAFPPTSAQDWHLLSAQLQGIANKAIGKTILATLLAAVGFAVGAWQVLREGRERLWLFLFPIVACLGASAIHYYSLVPRLTLFFLPLVVLLVCTGLASLAAAGLPRVVMLGLGVVVLSNQQRLWAFYRPFYGDYAELRTGLEFIRREQQPGEVVFMNHTVAPVARYYLLEHSPPLPLQSVVLQQYRKTSGDIIQQAIVRMRQQGVARVWLLYDLDDESMSTFAASQGRILKRHNFERGYVLLLAFR